MTGWRHTVLLGNDCGSCWHESFQIGAPQDSICTTPVPDPASPCEECWLAAGMPVHGPVDWLPVTSQHLAHAHVPTRCTCRHPIEPTR